MVNLTIEEWQRQSSLLLQARPTTTRITTKYNIPNLDAPKYQKAKKRKRDGEAKGEDGTAAAARVPRAALTLKTFDPESGVVLKVKTDRAADVGRLVNSLGNLARHMAALPQKTEEITMQDAPAPAQEDAVASTNASHANAPTTEKPQQQVASKKKKKGKK